MDELPDEVLVLVFSYVADGLSLLDAVPLVCKRWLQLSRDPRAWAGVRVRDSLQADDDDTDGDEADDPEHESKVRSNATQGGTVELLTFDSNYIEFLS